MTRALSAPHLICTGIMMEMVMKNTARKTGIIPAFSERTPDTFETPCTSRDTRYNAQAEDKRYYGSGHAEQVFFADIQFPVNRECEQERQSVIRFIAGKRSDQQNDHQKRKIAQNKGVRLAKSEEYTDHKEKDHRVAMAF